MTWPQTIPPAPYLMWQGCCCPQGSAYWAPRPPALCSSSWAPVEGSQGGPSPLPPADRLGSIRAQSPAPPSEGPPVLGSFAQTWAPLRTISIHPPRQAPLLLDGLNPFPNKPTGCFSCSLGQIWRQRCWSGAGQRSRILVSRGTRKTAADSHGPLHAPACAEPPFISSVLSHPPSLVK